MNKLRVFADFHNADVKGRVRLNCAGTTADIKRQEIVLREGQSLIIYSEELEGEGIVHYSEEEKLWTAVIAWDAIREVEPIIPQSAIQAISKLTIQAISHRQAISHMMEKNGQTVATLLR